MKRPRPINLYTKSIMDYLKVDNDTARLVERLMRNTKGTLDSLTRAKFNTLAKYCHTVLESDAELTKMIKEEEGIS